jgi:hypothetical protein
MESRAVLRAVEVSVHDQAREGIHNGKRSQFDYVVASARPNDSIAIQWAAPCLTPIIA